MLLEAGGLRSGHEAAEAQELWTAVLREAPRMHTPFDQAWFESLLATRAGCARLRAPAAAGAASGSKASWRASTARIGARRRTCSTSSAAPTSWRCLRAGCWTSAAGWWPCWAWAASARPAWLARLAQELAPGFERVYWRSLRNAPPVGEWLAGAIGFLSDQQLVPPAAESERLAVLLRLLRERRCLLVLDNFETLLEPGQREGALPGRARGVRRGCCRR